MKEDGILEEMINRYPALESCRKDIIKAGEAIIHCYRKQGKLLLCGNGGSCADADHIVGELMKSFMKRRPVDDDLQKNLRSVSPERGELIAEGLQKGLPAISLNAHAALFSAISNDMDPSLVFAQQIAAYGKKNDALIALSTSGDSPNMIDAVITAKAKGMLVIGLTGQDGGKMKPYCDIAICVPATETPEVQELHLPAYHGICKIVENSIFE
jgi:D-sedoheptulose 7-phosphate isomerase